LFADEFHLTNETREPVGIGVRRQQMSLQLQQPRESFGAVSARVWPRVGVNADVLGQMIASLEQFRAVRTLERPAVAVHLTTVSTEVARPAEAAVAQRAPVWLLARVDPRVLVEMFRPTERLVASAAPERSVSAVSPGMLSAVAGRRESVTAHNTLVRLRSRVSSPMNGQVVAAVTTLATVCAPVPARMHIHVT